MTSKALPVDHRASFGSLHLEFRPAIYPYAVTDGLITDLYIIFTLREKETIFSPRSPTLANLANLLNVSRPFWQEAVEYLTGSFSRWS
jgi:hypothetical protein